MGVIGAVSDGPVNDGAIISGIAGQQQHFFNRYFGATESLDDWPRYNDLGASIIEADIVDGDFRAQVKSNASNVTTFFDALYGMGLYRPYAISFPFEVIVRGIGVTTAPSGSPYSFLALAIVNLATNPTTWSAPFDYLQMAAGHRGPEHYVFELKDTVSSDSTVESEGDISSTGLGDIRLVGSTSGGRHIEAYYRDDNTVGEGWTGWRGGALELQFGTRVTWGTSVVMGFHPYAFELAGLPFTALCSSIELVSGEGTSL